MKLLLLLLLVFVETCSALLGYVDPNTFKRDVDEKKTLEIPPITNSNDEADMSYAEAERKYVAAMSRVESATKAGGFLSPKASNAAKAALSKASDRLDKTYSSISALYAAQTTLSPDDQENAIDMIADSKLTAAKYKLAAASYLSKGLMFGKKTSGVEKSVETSPKIEAATSTSAASVPETTKTTFTATSKDSTTTLTTTKGTATATATQTTTKAQSGGDKLSIKIAATLIPAILLSVFVIG